MIRILLIETPDYKNDKYIKTKNIYEKNIKLFHSYYVKMKTKLTKDFNIKLYGFDKKLKYKYNELNVNKIINDIQKMPMGNIRPTNLSLYADYNKKTSNKKFGYKDKKKALETILLLKNEPKKYQMSVINTLIGRAKFHPHQTKDMKEAIIIFNNWKEKNI
jgi:hypothetical protein